LEKANTKKTLGQEIMSFVKSKQAIVVLVVLFVSLTPIFAAGSTESIDALDNWGQSLLNIFQSTWVKALLMVALIVEALAMVFAGQQGGGAQIIKRFAPWIIGTLILLCSSGIASYFFDGIDLTA
jgi:hypothetical protein